MKTATITRETKRGATITMNFYLRDGAKVPWGNISVRDADGNGYDKRLYCGLVQEFRGWKEFGKLGGIHDFVRLPAEDNEIIYEELEKFLGVKFL